MMSITLTAFIFSILCSYGFNAVSEKLAGFDKKVIMIIYSVFFFIGLFILFISDGFSYLKFGESLQPQVEIIVKNIRQEFLYNDLKRYFFILIIFVDSKVKLVSDRELKKKNSYEVSFECS